MASKVQDSAGPKRRKQPSPFLRNEEGTQGEGLLVTSDSRRD